LLIYTQFVLIYLTGRNSSKIIFVRDCYSFLSQQLPLYLLW